MEVYVHNNPGNIVFNSYILLFVRSWYLPWDPEKENPSDDSWVRMPAFRSPGPNGLDHYVSLNANVENLSPVVLAEEECVVLRVGQLKPRKPVPKGLILSILDEAIDISAWEKENQKSWPFRDMFDEKKMAVRHAAKFGASTTQSGVPSNTNFALVRKSVMPKPCRRCGRNRVRTQ